MSENKSKSDMNKTEEEDKALLFQQLAELIKKMGWGIAIPELKEKDAVPGLIIGTDEYLQTITSLLPKPFEETPVKDNMYV